MVEGARLESGYTVLSRIEGSNPFPSAILPTSALIQLMKVAGREIGILASPHICVGCPIGPLSAIPASPIATPIV